MFHLIGFIIFGLIVGLIARAILPGRQHMTLTATTLLGMAGALIAGYMGRVFGWYGPDDGAGFIMSTAGAILLLVAYHFFARNRNTSVLGSSNSDYPRKVA